MTTFANPSIVTINGYAGDAMEPCITPDGRFLIFNNSNAPGQNTDLHVASIGSDYKTFNYLGPLAFANTPHLEGCPAADQCGNLYFVSDRSYATDRNTVYRTTFINGGVYGGATSVTGLSKHQDGWFTMDICVTTDGAVMFAVDAKVETPGGVPVSMTIVAALRMVNVNTYIRDDNSISTLLGAVNSEGLNYAPSISPDGKELFFTRASGGYPPTSVQIMVASRSDINQPFGAPKAIEACEGFVEAPSISADGCRLYYHKREAGVSAIYVVDRG